MTALLVAVVMMMALSAVAWAADITITNTGKPADSTDNTTYEWYQVMKAEINSQGADEGVTYYVDTEDWANVLKGVKVDNEAVFTVTPSADGSRWNVTSDITEAKAEKLAAALDAVKSNFRTKSDATFKANEKQTVDPGYYLITSSLGTKLILQTLDSETVNEKNTYPSTDKNITKENDTEVEAAKSNDVSIGDTVTYTVPVTIPENVAEKEIVLTDTMHKGLTLDKTSLANDQNLTLSFVDGTASGDYNVYTITIPASDVIANKGKTITITYTATLNENAVVDGDGNPNKIQLAYDNYTTKEFETVTKTYDYSIKKIDGNGADLNGAEFVLYADADHTTAINFTEADGVYTKAVTGGNSKLVAGKIELKGLDAGTYYLVETKAPEGGYNLLTVHKEVVVSATSGKDGDKFDLEVENNQGTELPSTGGMGTTILYIVGAVLIIGAVVLLITRRRLNAEK